MVSGLWREGRPTFHVVHDGRVRRTIVGEAKAVFGERPSEGGVGSQGSVPVLRGRSSVSPPSDQASHGQNRHLPYPVILPRDFCRLFHK